MIGESLKGDSFVGGQVFGETPNTATETVALPNLTESLRLRRFRLKSAALLRDAATQETDLLLQGQPAAILIMDQIGTPGEGYKRAVLWGV